MVMASNNYDETQSCHPSICCHGGRDDQDREPEKRRGKPNPNGAAAAKEGGGGCNERLWNIRNDRSRGNNGNGYNNSKRRRRDSFSNLLPRNIPARAECTDIDNSSSCNPQDGSGRSYLPTLKEAHKRAELVHSLQQQIRKLEKELARKMKEEKAASFAGPGSGRKRKRHTAWK